MYLEVLSKYNTTASTTEHETYFLLYRMLLTMVKPFLLIK